MVSTDGSRALPRKENDLFKSIVKFYELKQYKKGAHRTSWHLSLRVGTDKDDVKMQV